MSEYRFVGERHLSSASPRSGVIEIAHSRSRDSGNIGENVYSNGNRASIYCCTTLKGNGWIGNGFRF